MLVRNTPLMQEHSRRPLLTHKPVHAGGSSLAEAFAQVALAQWGYMTDPNSIKLDPECDRVIEASGRDPITLLYNFMDKCLYEFTGDDFLAQELTVLDFVCPHVPHAVPADIVGPDADDRHRPESERCYIRCSARGERFVFGRHPQGTEVKAVTFSNMQIVVQTAGAAGGSGSSTDTTPAPMPGTAYSGVSEVVRGGVRLRQYSANEADELGQGLEAEAEGGAGQTVAAASALEVQASGEGSGLPGLSAATVSAPTPAPTAAAQGQGQQEDVMDGPQGDEESVCSPAGGAGAGMTSEGLPFDAHADSALLGTRRGPVDVYVIVDI